MPDSAQMCSMGLYPQNIDSFPSGQPDRVSPAECSGLNPHATPVLSWTQLPNRLYAYSHKHTSEKLVLAGSPDVSLKRGQHQSLFNLGPSINQHFSADKRAISQVPAYPLPSSYLPAEVVLSKVVDLNHTECINVLHVRASAKGDWWGWQASTISAIVEKDIVSDVRGAQKITYAFSVLIHWSCCCQPWPHSGKVILSSLKGCQMGFNSRSGSTQPVFSNSHLFYLNERIHCEKHTKMINK